MKGFVLVLFFTWLFTLFLPWWGVLIPTFIIGLWLLKGPFNAFLIGFLGAGSAWFIQALYIHIANDGILSSRIADMMGVGSPWIVLLITFAVGALAGGVGALTGYLLKVNLNKPDRDGG
tara:strand:- start:51045 stop:51401 length:357 start_codon:yes stop_codon:yes gene_type:complete